MYVKCSVLEGLAIPAPIPTPLVAPTVIMFEIGALLTFEENLHDTFHSLNSPFWVWSVLHYENVLHLSALKNKSVSFIPDDVDLSMTLDIELHNTALEFESCCTSYSYP